jgi:ABC-type glycerol-3-phosphate transport system substrate-binding protein
MKDWRHGGHLSVGHSRRALLREGGALVGAAMTVAACGTAAGSGTGQPAASKIPVTITYLSPGEPPRQQLETEMFGRFTAELPHLTVNIAPETGWPGVKQKFLVAAAAGTPANAAQAGWGGVWLDMWDQGSVVDLAPYFKRDKISPEATFFENPLYQWQNGAVIGGLPVTSSILGLAYNKDLFAAAGLKPPPLDPTATWWNMEAFLDTAKKLTDRNRDLYGFGGLVGSGNGEGLTNGTYFGLRPWNDATKKAGLDTADFQKALQWWKDVKFLQQAQPSDQENAALKAQASGDIFLSGKVGMQVVYNLGRVSLPFKWDLATLPYSGKPGSKNMSGTNNTHGLIMGKVGDVDREATWQLYRWLLKPENGGLFPISAGHAVSPLKNPAATEVAQRRFREQTGFDAKAYALHAPIAMAYTDGLSKYANWPQCQAAIDPKYSDFMANKLSVSEYASFATKYIDDNLVRKS